MIRPAYIGLTLLWIMIVSISCSGNKHVQSGDIKTESPVFDRTFRLSVSDSVIIDDVFDIQNWSKYNNRLIVHDYATDSVISLYRWPTGELLYSDVNIGSGPDEYIVINPGDAFKSDNVLLYDIMKRKISIFASLNDSLSLTDEFELFTDSEGLAYPYTYISQLSDSVFILKTDMPDESSWHIADLRNMSLISKINNPVRNTEESYTPYDFIQIPADSTLAVVYKYIDLIQFYDISSTLEHPSLSKSYGDLNNQGKIMDYNNLEHAYISASKYKDLLYCLKSSDGGECGDRIEVFRFNDRKPYGVIEIDRNVMSIRCDENGNIIGYTPCQDSSMFYVWEYDITQLTQPE